MKTISCALKGRVKTSVLQGGRVVHENPFQRNLILDQGLDQLATTNICDLFLYAVIGTGTPHTTREELTGTYTAGGTTLTRDSGARDFTSGDVGKLVRFSSGAERYIDGYTSATTVTLSASAAESGDTAVVLYNVGLDNVVAEAFRTNEVSVATGENGTDDTGAVRTFTRTFIFPASLSAPVALAGTYTLTTNTIVRTGGTKLFNSGDIGKIITLDNDVEYTITATPAADTITVTPSGSHVSTGAELSGFTDVTEVGFSHSSDEGIENINIYIALDSTVRVYNETRLTPAQQLKVQYQLDLTFSPSTTQPSTSTYASFPITDPGNLMSAVKTGQWAIENILTSTVDPDGSTNTSQAILDPAAAGFFGISKDSTAIDPLDGAVRTTGLVTKAFEASDYVAGSFEKDFTVTLSANEAVSTLWRSIMLCDPTTGLPAFTFLFRYPQSKDSDHSLQFVLRKTWGRDLS